MFRMMIVEDEPWIRKGLEKVLPWEELNIKYVGHASNGEEALQLLDSYMPDIILTDIKMPKVDGITLVKKIHEIMPPNVHVVILTGYNDFQYIKEAIKYSVTDYILKPVNPAELKATIQKITAKLEDERERKLHLLKLQLGNYIYEHLMTPDDSEDLSVEIPDPYACLLLSTDQIPLHELACEKNVNHVFPFAAGYSTLYYLGFKSKAAAESFAARPVKALLGLTFGISDVFSNDQMEFDGAFRQAHFSLLNQLSQGLNSPENGIGSAALLTQEKEKELVALLTTGNGSNAPRYIQRLLEPYTGFNAQWTVLFQLYTILLRYQQSDKFTIKQTNWMFRFKSAHTTVDLQSLIDDLLLPVVDSIMKDWNRSYSELVGQAKEYIREHYTDSSLSLSRVANHLQIAPSYLSCIFKSELDINYVTYLTEIRVEHAKGRLSGSDEPVYTVSEKAGFNDVKYFTRVFKKMTGFSPKQYREKVLR
jgi:two-component system response regulator YesN